MNKVKIYQAEIWNSICGKYVLIPKLATRETIRAIKTAKIIKETEREVDADCIDAFGYLKN